MNTELTPREKLVLNKLAEAWNAFLLLDDRSLMDDFLRSIHTSQPLIALRVARRVDPNVWH
jgi:hypothetical protein